MHNSLIKYTVAMLLCANLSVHAQTITIGAVAMDAPIEMIKRMTPLAGYLAKETGYVVRFRPAPNLLTAVKDLGENTVQIAYLTPMAYITAHEHYQAIPLVSPLTRGKSTFHLLVVVHRDSPHKKLTDLVGKRFAFGDPKAYLQPAILLDAGVRREDFSEVAYLKHYDNIAKALLMGDFDGGIMKDTVYEKFAAQGLRVVHASPPLASYIFAVNAKLDSRVQQKLKQAFLKLNHATPEGSAVLKSLDQGYDGFQVVTDQDYDRERALIAPFIKGSP